MKNILKLWDIDQDILKEFHTANGVCFDALHHDAEGFRILLKINPHSKILKICFKNKLSYRSTNESFMFNAHTFENDAPFSSTFYKIENSTYIDEFHKNTSNAYDDWEITHYFIATNEDCIDILSSESPIFDWLN